MGKCLTNGSLGRGIFVLFICLFPWCKYSHIVDFEIPMSSHWMSLGRKALSKSEWAGPIAFWKRTNYCIWCSIYGTGHDGFLMPVSLHSMDCEVTKETISCSFLFLQCFTQCWTHRTTHQKKKPLEEITPMLENIWERIYGWRMYFILKIYLHMIF